MLFRSGKLDSDEFEKFLARIGIFLTKQELRAVYDIYDPNLDRLITFQEFIEPLKVMKRIIHIERYEQRTN